MGNRVNPLPALVSQHTYEVQPGDSVDRIAAQYVRADRWPELVAANQLHKGLVDGPPEVQHAVFDSLEPHEHLLVPAAWVDHSGALGAPIMQKPPTQITGTVNPSYSGAVIDPSTAFVAAFQAAYQNIKSYIDANIRPFQIPAGYQPQDLGKVIATWFPYLSGIPVGVARLDPSLWDLGVLSWATVRAADLLAVAQVTPEVLRQIPWGSIPWTQVPWSSVPQDAWPFIAAIGAGPARGAGYSSLYGQAVNSMFTKSAGISKFDPRNTDFSAGVWPQVPWSAVPWDALDPTILADTDVQRCLADPDAPARIAAMKQYPDCFAGKGVAVFKKYLCKTNGAYEELSKCSQTAQPPPQCAGTIVQTPLGPACIPVGASLPTWAAGIDWTCQPFPQCAYDQIQAKFPAGTTPPCPPPPAQGGAFPACIPDMLAAQGFQLPAGTVATPKQEAKTNTGVYVAAAAGAVVVLGGLVYLLASRTAEASTKVPQEG